jgi:hypothetical protein
VNQTQILAMDGWVFSTMCWTVELIGMWLVGHILSHPHDPLPVFVVFETIWTSEWDSFQLAGLNK